MFSPCMRVYSGFLPPSKNIHVRLIDDSKIVPRSEFVSLSRLSLCGPVMDWRPVQGVNWIKRV